MANPRKTVLVLEDEPLIALDLEYMLGQARFKVIVIASRAAANGWLNVHTPAVAIIDIQLKDGVCADVARKLTAREVPFIVCSGALIADHDPVFTRVLVSTRN